MSFSPNLAVYNLTAFRQQGYIAASGISALVQRCHPGIYVWLIWMKWQEKKPCFLSLIYQRVAMCTAAGSRLEHGWRRGYSLGLIKNIYRCLESVGCRSLCYTSLLQYDPQRSGA